MWTLFNRAEEGPPLTGTEGDRTILPLVRRGAAILLVGSHLPLLHGEKPPSHPPECVARPDLQAPSPAGAVGRAPGPGGRRQVRASPRVAAHIDKFHTGHGTRHRFPSKPELGERLHSPVVTVQLHITSPSPRPFPYTDLSKKNLFARSKLQIHRLF